MHSDTTLEQLISTVQLLSLARSMDTVTGIVRHTARSLTGADGVTFVLREGDMCYYADEDAIAPLWKGQRFPMGICVSGWVMENARAAAIPDIFADSRIPADVYRATFVQSLAMVPIRSIAPIGAIGAYWAEQHEPTREELQLLQSLADVTAVTMENIQVYAELEQRVRDRTEELQQTVDKLQKAAGEIRTLRGFIPICAHCKGVRDDTGYWHRIEAYLAAHTEAQLSHGICPDCLEQHFGDMMDP